MTKLREQVKAFREASRLPADNHPSEPTVPSLPRVQLAACLCIEEPLELLEALGADPELIRQMKELASKAIAEIDLQKFDMVKVADGLGDSDYVNEWARSEFGIEGESIADEIQRSNMDKFGPGSYFREDGKVMKPPGWQPPDIAGVLWSQGWRGGPVKWVVAVNPDQTQWVLTTEYNFRSPVNNLDVDDRPMEIVGRIETGDYEEAKRFYEDTMDKIRSCPSDQ